jgi:hypothetical protein
VLRQVVASGGMTSTALKSSAALPLLRQASAAKWGGEMRIPRSAVASTSDADRSPRPM